jgi:hypothetical protein
MSATLSTRLTLNLGSVAQVEEKEDVGGMSFAKGMQQLGGERGK